MGRASSFHFFSFLLSLPLLLLLLFIKNITSKKGFSRVDQREKSPKGRGFSVTTVFNYTDLLGIRLMRIPLWLRRGFNPTRGLVA